MSLYTTKIPAMGPDANIYVIRGRASRLLRELDYTSDEIAMFQQRVADAVSYDAACAIVEEYFPLERDES